MAVAKFTQPDYTSMSAAAYKAALDAAAQVLARMAGPFAPHEQATPDMSVRIDAGHIPAQAARPTEVTAQSTATLVAPASNPRYDIVYVDAATGTVGVAAGSESATPSDPAVPAGKVAIARVRLMVGMTEIGNADLDDLRSLSVLGLGSAAFQASSAFETAGAAAAVAATLGDLAAEDDAAGVPFDNVASGLAATNVQDALDELADARFIAGTPLVQNPMASGTVTQAHGLPGKPQLFSVVAECLTAENGYSIGDTVQFGTHEHTGGSATAFQVYADATNVVLLNAGTQPNTANKSTRVNVNLTLANWKLTITPYYRS